jgi:hypothetical protein
MIEKSLPARMFVALAQLSPHEGLIRPASLSAVMIHLTSPLNISFTLPQPKGAQLIAP